MTPEANVCSISRGPQSTSPLLYSVSFPGLSRSKLETRKFLQVWLFGWKH